MNHCACSNSIKDILKDSREWGRPNIQLTHTGGFQLRALRWFYDGGSGRNDKSKIYSLGSFPSKEAAQSAIDLFCTFPEEAFHEDVWGAYGITGWEFYVNGKWVWPSHLR